MDYDRICFHCGDPIHGPFMVLGGFVKGLPYFLAFHQDCYFLVTKMFNDQFEETRRVVTEEMKRPKG